MLPYANLCYKVKRKIALLLSLVMIWGMALQVSAEETVGILAEGEIGITSRPEGIVLSIDVLATTDADEIGCRDVVLHETYNGVTRDIKIQGRSTSGNSFGGSMTYTDAIKGATYSASCTFYARWGNTEETLTGNTGSLVYN